MTKKQYKIAFIGFRHGHIYSLYTKAAQHPSVEIVAACEEEATAREAVLPSVKITHTSWNDMLATVPCDIVAIGDYYSKRGQLALDALAKGKHVILDKPICTTLTELGEMEALAARHDRRIGCMLDLRTAPAFVAARQAIRDGLIGRVTQIQFGGQHPLLRDSRPEWYFEEGKHGGTINDIAIHAVDMLKFLTGESIKRIVAARTWQAFDVRSTSFNDAAQLMLELGNGCGVLGDVSYAAPDSQGYTLPTYWRFTVWGTKGLLEFAINEPQVKAYLNGDKNVKIIDAPRDTGPDFLDSFLSDIQGKPLDLNTATVVAASRKTLDIQAYADSHA